jgi:Icc-related predicted phosphoesterase
MRIGVISDLHIVYSGNVWQSKSKNAAVRDLLSEIDCLVMCGDNAEPTTNLDNQRRLLENLREASDLPIAFITGNHDLIGHVPREGVSITELRNQLSLYSAIASKYNVTHLEDKNLELEGICICGTYGHYDATISGKRFQEDYGSVSALVSGLLQRAQDVSGKKLLVTHSVPNKVMIGRPDGPVQDRYTPFAGSTQLEDAIRKIKPNWHFCGHTHAYAESKIDDTLSFNVGTDYDNLFYFIVDTSDDSVRRLEKKL